MNKKSNLPLYWSGAAIVAWLLYWMIKTRYAMLDDALIHLHYADFLSSMHAISFDGIHRSFGTSSLFYVSLLAVLRNVSSSPLLPKVVSDISYLTQIALIFYLIATLKEHLRSRLLLGGLLICLLSPMAIRWLTDGMETSLTSLFVIVLAVLVKREQASVRQTGLRFALLVLFGAALVYLRIELSMLVALCCLSIAAVKLNERQYWPLALFRASPLSVGAVLAMISIRVMLGSLLPDTALAKVGGDRLAAVVSSFQVLGSAFALGMGTFLCWLISAWFVARRDVPQAVGRPSFLLSKLLENAAFPLLVFLSSMRRQNIAGVRYILWPLVFAIVSNALMLALEEREPGEARALGRTEKRLAVCFVIAIVCVMPVDWYLGSRSMMGRAQTFLEMRSGHMDRLFAGKTIIAGDVGFITYFSQGHTCDLDGLVNGRVMAALGAEKRASFCASQSPAMLFLSLGQARGMSHYLNLNDWTVCGIFDFTNVRHNDRHYLLVPSAEAAQTCRQLHFNPAPLAAVIGGKQ